MFKRLLIGLTLILSTSITLADTFTSKSTGEVLHGFATCKVHLAETTVCTEEKGIIRLNLMNYDIEYNAIGRKPLVTYIKINKAPIVSTERDSIGKAIKNAANRGYLMVIIEIDASGGNRYVIENICSDITGINNLPIAAFINDPINDGAFADCIALALACDRIFIASTASMGCAETKYDEKKQKEIDSNIDLRAQFGDVVGEKFTSAYRGYIHALAQRNNRPQLLASAMIDKNIDVLEVKTADSKTDFIQQVNKKESHKLIKTWSTKGSLLKISAADAVKTGMADKIANNTDEILKYYNIQDAQIEEFTKHVETRKSFEQAKASLIKINRQIALRKKSLQKACSNKQKAAILSNIARNYTQKLKIAAKHPEFNIKPAFVRTEITAIKAQIAELRGR